MVAAGTAQAGVTGTGVHGGQHCTGGVACTGEAPSDTLSRLFFSVQQCECFTNALPGCVMWLSIPLKTPLPPCRLPASIQTPYERSGLSPAQFSRWLDQHSTGDVARGVANALQAAKAEVAAAEAGSEGSRAVLAVMKQLCGM